MAAPSFWNEYLQKEQSALSLLHRLDTINTPVDLTSMFPQKPAASTSMATSRSSSPGPPSSPASSSASSSALSSALSSASSPSGPATPARREPRKRVHFSASHVDLTPPPHARGDWMPAPIAEWRYFCGNLVCSCPSTRLYLSAREHVLASTTPTYVCSRGLCSCDRDRAYVDKQQHDEEALKRRWVCDDDGCVCEASEVYVDKQNHDEHVKWLRSSGRLPISGSGNSVDSEEIQKDILDMNMSPIDPALEQTPSDCSSPDATPILSLLATAEPSEDGDCYFALEAPQWDDVPRRAEAVSSQASGDDDDNLTNASTVDSDAMPPSPSTLQPAFGAVSWLHGAWPGDSWKASVPSNLVFDGRDSDVDEWDDNMVDALSFA